MKFFELLDAIHECLHAFQIHRVVARCTESAYQTVTLDTYHAALGGELEELVLQIFVTGFEYEADVHATAVFLVEDCRCEQLRLVEALVQQVSFGFVACLNPLHSAVGFQPAQGE